MRVVTASGMRAIDAAAVARDGEETLMTRAGEAIASLIDRYARSDGALVGIAGDGNNGGDAFAALAAYPAARRRLCWHDPAVDGSPARVDARERAREAGVELRPFPVRTDDLHDAALVLDGVLGAGARLPLGVTQRERIGAIAGGSAPVLALDVPSGIDPTTGARGETTVCARATIALGLPKLGCFLDPARAVIGDLWCAPIGMRETDVPAAEPVYETLTAGAFAGMLPRRSDDSEKRASGAPLIVAGSTQFPGAAILCAWGAARAGAGYVTVCVPEGAAAAVRAQLVEPVVITYDERDPDAAIETILDVAGRCGSLGIGPGMGLSDGVGRIVNGVVTRIGKPIVADASALFHFAKRLEPLRGLPLVVTPHAGEFARLSGQGTVEPAQRLPRVRSFVERSGITTLLKGRVTIVASPDATYINPTGTPALATAGTGDVLTGAIATLLAQGLRPYDAACTGAYWHGRAGHVAASARPVGVIARDVADALGAASVVRDDAPALVRLW